MKKKNTKNYAKTDLLLILLFYFHFAEQLSVESDRGKYKDLKKRNENEKKM